MIKYLKQYADKTFEELVNSLIWFDNPLKLKAIFAKLPIPTPVDSRPYKVYTALLTQEGTDAPVATILENTLGGDIVWSYFGVGTYRGTLTGAFTIDKTFTTITPRTIDGTFVIERRDGSNEIGIQTAIKLTNVLSNEFLYCTEVEIRVYN